MGTKPKLFLFTMLAVAALGAPAELEEMAEDAPAEAQIPGVQTPGVQISADKLLADQEYEWAPSWLLFSDSIFGPSEDGQTLSLVDTKSFEMKDPEPGFDHPCAGAVSAFSSLWVMDCGSGEIIRLNLKAKEEEDRLQAKIATGVAEAAWGIAASTDSIWALTDDKTTLARIDPAGNRVVAEMRLPSNCNQLVFGEGALWVNCPEQSEVLRINSKTNLVEKHIKVAENPSSIVLGSGSVWVLGLKEGKVDQIDPETNKVTKSIELKVPDATGTIAFGEGSLWASLTGFPVTRINPDDARVMQQFHGSGGGDLHIGSGALWLTNVEEGTLWKIDPKRILATIGE